MDRVTWNSGWGDGDQVSGFWVLVWDAFTGDGLNLVNPRLHVDGNGNNWWPKPVYWQLCSEAEVRYRVKETMQLENLYGERFQVVVSFAPSDLGEKRQETP